jgi:hypothetical protein
MLVEKLALVDGVRGRVLVVGLEKKERGTHEFTKQIIGWAKKIQHA